MSVRSSYTRHFIYSTIRMGEYVRRFRAVGRIEGYCRECHNYGHHWGCPPFVYDVDSKLRDYNEVLLLAARITPHPTGLPLADGMRCLLPVRHEMEEMVREMETVMEGIAMGLAGQCAYCPDGQCSKPAGLPCRHPELVRPSLEAWGFDVCQTTEQLMHLPILWSTDGVTPAYFTLVCGFFYNGVPELAKQNIQTIIQQHEKDSLYRNDSTGNA
ncbi:MAG: DUF2284 domain-containing protein [Paludibacteraceae bacterium]|nr:DUF2284 domain-containing protein [Paludibacteraceae bacterium]